ncbi:hypothetical protein HRS9139_02546 [Pyrenophora teres f. teres]|nr:hypothetical protein HRS9139_02546 [Pyrenophora teres f. teres]
MATSSKDQAIEKFEDEVSSNLQNQPASLLDIPFGLLPITQRNTALSPLLRLPAEVRNRIWEYTLTHHIILLSAPPLRKVKAVCEIRRIERVIYFSALMHLPPEIRYRIWTYKLTGDNISVLAPSVYISNGVCIVDKPQRIIYSPYYMPAVCRQIYAETSPLIFELNKFEVWQNHMTKVSEHPSFCNIQSLYFRDTNFMGLFDQHPVPYTKTFFTEAAPLKPYFTRMFPQLKHLTLARGVIWNLWYFDSVQSKDVLSEELEDKYRNLLERRIREKEGNFSLKFTWTRNNLWLD